VWEIYQVDTKRNIRILSKTLTRSQEHLNIRVMVMEHPLKGEDDIHIEQIVMM
jgi:hypothetical protein